MLAVMVCSIYLGSWNSEWTMTSHMSWQRSFVSRTSKKDTSIVVISTVSLYPRIKAHYVIICVWKRKNDTRTNRCCTKLSEWLFNDTKKTEQLTNKRRNALCWPNVDKGGCHNRLTTRGCPGSYDFLTWNSNLRGCFWRHRRSWTHAHWPGHIPTGWKRFTLDHFETHLQDCKL